MRLEYEKGCQKASDQPVELVTDEGGGGEAVADTAACCNEAESEFASAPISKNELRSLRRQKRLQEAKERRRALRADAKRRKKCARREAGAKGIECREDARPADTGLRLCVCVDCEYEELQCESEIFSLVQQLMYAYGDAKRLNRLRDRASGTRRRWKSGWRAESGASEDGTADCASAASGVTPALGPRNASRTPKDLDASSTTVLEAASVHPSAVAGSIDEAAACSQASIQEGRPAVELCIAGVGPKVRDALKRVQCNGRWKCDVSSLPFERRFAQQCAAGQAVYLTADADEELQTLDTDTVYIVGGIVDRNRYKGLTLARSRERGVRTAKLPISSKLGRKLEGSKILTVNQARPSTQTTAPEARWHAKIYDYSG